MTDALTIQAHADARRDLLRSELFGLRSNLRAKNEHIARLEAQVRRLTADLDLAHSKFEEHPVPERMMQYAKAIDD